MTRIDWGTNGYKNFYYWRSVDRIGRKQTGVLMATQYTAGLTTGEILTAATMNSIGAAWESYTPTITQGATLTKTIDYAKYTQINKLVVCHITCTITSAGTAANILTVSLPLTPANVDQPFFGCNGSATFYDASAATPYVLGVHIGASSIVNFVGIAAGGDYFGVVPAVTAANGDVISFIISYETT